jgi:hypothetical protein
MTKIRYKCGDQVWPVFEWPTVPRLYETVVLDDGAEPTPTRFTISEVCWVEGQAIIELKRLPNPKDKEDEGG